MYLGMCHFYIVLLSTNFFAFQRFPLKEINISGNTLLLTVTMYNILYTFQITNVIFLLKMSVTHSKA